MPRYTIDELKELAKTVDDEDTRQLYERMAFLAGVDQQGLAFDGIESAAYYDTDLNQIVYDPPPRLSRSQYDAMIARVDEMHSIGLAHLREHSPHYEEFKEGVDRRAEEMRNRIRGWLVDE